MRLIRYAYPIYRSTASALGALPRSPWSGLETEIDRLFESALRDFGGSDATGRFPVDLYEDNDNTYVRAELPGVSRDDINVEIANGRLTITAARKTQDSGEAKEAFTLSRSVAVEDDIDSAKVGATYENGVLTVTLPKREEAKPRKISVAVK